MLADRIALPDEREFVRRKRGGVDQAHIGGHGDTLSQSVNWRSCRRIPDTFASSTMTFGPTRSRCSATTAVVNPVGMVSNSLTTASAASR